MISYQGRGSFLGHLWFWGNGVYLLILNTDLKTHFTTPFTTSSFVCDKKTSFGKLITNAPELISRKTEK